MTRKEETNQAAQEYIHSTLVDSPHIRTTAFRAGAEWADKTILDKVCKFINENFATCRDDYDETHVESYEFDSVEDLIEDIKRLIEEE